MTLGTRIVVMKDGVVQQEADDNVRTALSAILTKNFLKLLAFIVKPPFEVQNERKNRFADSTPKCV